MTAETIRSGPERQDHVLALLRAQHAEVWVASASADGAPHLVPLSLAWDERQVILSVERRSLTARNLTSAQRARLALGTTGDVVLIDAVLAAQVDVTEAGAELTEAYAGQADWDPRQEEGGGAGYVYLCLTPERIQVWRSLAEHSGRTIMRAGQWPT
jgi:hypothetical protein